MSAQPRPISTANAPNTLLVVKQHIAANITEADEEIARLQKRLEQAIADREALRAIARAAGVSLDPAEPVVSTSSPVLSERSE